MENNNRKLEWIFDALEFLLENTPTINNEEKRIALLNEADSIQVDEEVEEQDLDEPKEEKDGN